MTARAKEVLLEQLTNFLAGATSGAVVAGLDPSGPLMLGGLLAYVATGSFRALTGGHDDARSGRIERWAKRTWKEVRSARRDLARELELAQDGLERLDEVIQLLELSAEIQQGSVERQNVLAKMITQNEKLNRAWSRHLLDRINDLQSRIDPADFHALLEASRRRPPLELELHASADPLRNVYFYRERRVEMVGREREMERLAAFLDDERPFLWWFVTGQGGMGKSRIAYEMCLARTDWWAGFLPRGDFNGWDTWFPEEPTLIVVDYVYVRPAIADVLRTLTQRRESLGHPVRVLLLEREVDERQPWHHEFVGLGEAEKRALYSQRYEASPCEIGPLDDAAIGRIAQQLAGAVDHAAAVAVLSRDELGRRPLYISYAADALTDGKDVVRWSASQLSQHVLGRERQRWQGCGIVGKWESLLALATMTGGLDLSEGNWPELLDGAAFRAMLPSRDAVCNGWHERFGHHGNDWQRRLAAVAPDPLGEIFVIERLSEMAAAHCGQLLDLAWRIAPVAMMFFCHRAVRDFPDHTSLEPLLRTRGEPGLWAVLAVGYAASLSLARQTARAGGVIAELAALHEGHYDRSDIAIALIEALHIATSVEPTQMSCVALDDRIKGVPMAHDSLAIALAQALFNVTVVEPNPARVTLADQIEGLLAANNTSEVALALAAALYNPAEGGPNPPTLEALTDRIASLLDAYDFHEIALALEKARAWNPAG